MLKKILCMVIIAMTIMATLAVANVSAAENDTAETGKGFTCMAGDVDLDGKITIRDASMIQKAIAKMVDMTDMQFKAADTNDDGRINVKDATAIQKYLADIDVENIIGKKLETEEAAPENNKPSHIDNNKVVEVTNIEKAVAERFLYYVNQERAEVGVQPLRTNSALTKAAELRGDEIVESFSHTRPNGSQWNTAIDEYGFRRLGENVAYNAGIIHFQFIETDAELAEEIDYAARFFFGQFKGSSGHYKNMINEYFNSTGIGVNLVEHDGYTECYIAHMFGEAN